VKLTVDGRSYTTKVTVTNDPRSPATPAAVRAQVALQLELMRAMRVAYDGYRAAAAIRARLDSLVKTDSSESTPAMTALRGRLDSLAGVAPEDRFNSGGLRRLPTDFAGLHGRLEELFMAQENGDLAPTEAMRRTFTTICRDLTTTAGRWHTLRAQMTPMVNASLSKAGMSPVPIAEPLVPPTCSMRGP
jgi:hypothetical protein